MQPAKLDNKTVVEVLQNLHFNETKPPTLAPIDLVILAYLTLRRAVDHVIVDSIDTLARRTCASDRTVERSLDRLEKLGWIVVGGRGNGRTNTLSINIDKVPAARPIKDSITQDARSLAIKYQIALQRQGRTTFPKNWLQRQSISAQRIITDCNGDFSLALSIVEYALSTPKYREKAEESLYDVRLKWSGLVKSFHKASADQPEAQTSITPASLATVVKVTSTAPCIPAQVQVQSTRLTRLAAAITKKPEEYAEAIRSAGFEFRDGKFYILTNGREQDQMFAERMVELRIQAARYEQKGANENDGRSTTDKSSR
jgi:hypothetical protein